MYLNYNISKTFKMFIDLVVNYTFLKSLIVGLLLFCILVLINNKSDKTKYIVFALNLLIIISIMDYYGSNLFECFDHYLNNIYGYYLNSIIFLIVISILYLKKVINIKLLIPFYYISLVNILFSLFMTYYLKNNVLFVIGNIYPMIKFGNYIYIIFLVFILGIFICRSIRSKKYGR